MTKHDQERDLWFLLAGAALASKKARDFIDATHCSIDPLPELFRALRVGDNSETRRMRRMYELGDGRLLDEVQRRIAALVGHRAKEGVTAYAGNARILDDREYLEGVKARVLRALDLCPDEPADNKNTSPPAAKAKADAGGQVEEAASGGEAPSVARRSATTSAVGPTKAGRDNRPVVEGGVSASKKPQQEEKVGTAGGPSAPPPKTRPRQSGQSNPGPTVRPGRSDSQGDAP